MGLFNKPVIGEAPRRSSGFLINVVLVVLTRLVICTGSVPTGVVRLLGA